MLDVSNMPAPIDAELERSSTTPTLAELRVLLRPEASWSPERLLFATHPTRTGLIDAVERLLSRAEDAHARGVPLVELARSSRVPEWHSHRAAVVAATIDEAVTRLRLIRHKLVRHAKLAMPSGAYFSDLSGRPDQTVGSTALLFPGQGCQFRGMLVHLALRCPEVLDWFVELDRAYVARGAEPPSRLLLSPEDSSHVGLVDLRSGAQLGLIGSLALHELLDGWGVRPDVLVGHSNGEHAALIAGDVFRFSSKQRLAAFFCAGGLLLDGLAPPPEAEDVLAVGGAPSALLDEILGHAAGELFLAIDNCPQQKVLAGTARSVAAAAMRLQAAGASVMRVPIGRAYHTPLFEQCAATLRRHYEVLVPGQRRVPVISCLHGEPHPANPDEVRDWTASQWRHPVSFRRTVEILYEQGVRNFIEVGPDDTLGSFVRDTLRGKDVFVASASSRRRDDLAQLKHLVAQLAVFGPGLPPHALDWLDRIDSDEPVPDRRVGARTRVSVEPSPARPSSSAAAIEDARALYLGLCERGRAAQRWAAQLVQAPAPTSILGKLRAGTAGTVRLDLHTHPWLLDHAFGRGTESGHGGSLAVLSFTTSMALVCELAAAAIGQPVRELREIKARRWLALDGGELPLRYQLTPDADGWVRAQLWDERVDEPTPAFEASASPRARPSRPRNPPTCNPAKSLDPILRRFYDDIAFHGPRFRGLERIESVGQGRLRAHVRVRAPSCSPDLDPAVWDCVGQVAAVESLEHHDEPFGLYPLWAERCSLRRAPLGPDSSVQLDVQVEQLADRGTRTCATWLDGEGRELGHIEGLQQRRVPLHPIIQRLLRQPLGRSAAKPRDPVAPELEDWLRHNDPIWTRVLASCCLFAADHAAWSALPPDARLPELLHTLRTMEQPWCLN